MSVTLENGTQSYLSAADAKALAQLRGRTDFDALSDAAIEILITIATDYLEQSYDWVGDIATQTQDLSWPRIEAYDKHDRLIGSTVIPDEVKLALVELMIIANGNSNRILSLEQSAEVEEVGAGPARVRFKDGNIPKEGKRLEAVDRVLGVLIKPRFKGGAMNIGVRRV